MDHLRVNRVHPIGVQAETLGITCSIPKLRSEKLLTNGIISSSTKTPNPTKTISSSTILTPSATPPAGCQETFDGKISLEAINATTTNNRDLGAIECGGKSCSFTLKNGVLKNNDGETEYVDLDYELSFYKNPLNHDALYTGGFSICANRTLMLGGSALWWRCPGDYLYWIQQGDGCYPELLNAVTK